MPSGDLPARPAYVYGTDGKIYPSRRLLAEDREYLVSRVHYLKHAENLSVRKILGVLQDEHDVRRSVGWVAGIMRDWRCSKCSGVQ